MSPLERRARTILVEALLEEIAEARRRLYEAQAGGVRPHALRERESELEAAQLRLAALD